MAQDLESPTSSGTQLRTVASRLAVPTWTALFIGLVAFFVVHERDELGRIGGALRGADPWWVSGAVLMEIGVLALIVWSNRLLLHLLGHRVPWRTMTRVHFQRQVVSTVVPMGGTPAMYVFTRGLAGKGVPANDAFFTIALFGVLGYASFLLILLPVLAWLAIHGRVSGVILLGSAALLGFVSVLLGSLLLLFRGVAVPPRMERHLPRRAVTFVEQARSHGLTMRDLLPPFGIAVLVDLLNAALLYTCLRAVGQNVAPLAALAGYAVGTVFLLISPVFQGLGVVELSTSATLSQLGVPAGLALAATLLYRFCELWLPLAFGLSIQGGSHRAVRSVPPRLPAIVTGITGLTTVLSVLTPSLPTSVDRLDRYSPVAGSDASRTFTLVAGFFLIFLTHSLWRRKRVAWFATLALLTATVITHVTKGHDQVVAVVAATNVGLLLLYNRRFRVRSDLPTLRQGLFGFGLSLLFALAYGTLGFWLLDQRAFGVTFSLSSSLERTLRLFFSLGNAGLTPHTRYADWFLDSFSVVGIVALGYAAFSLVHPVIWRHHTLPAEREGAWKLIEEHGNSSLDWFRATEDKVFFFSSTGQGVVSYGVAVATAVALGDPVATNAAEFGRVLDEFLDFCDANGWRVAFHQVPPTYLEVYAARGLSSLKIGEDAVVDLERFTLQGHAMKSLRSAVNRFDRQGYQAVFRSPPQPDELLAQLREVSNQWLTIAGRRERTFTLGQFKDDYIRSSAVMTIENKEGRVVAFANLIPDGVPGEATIDLMRHRVDAPNGAMDVLFVRLFEQSQELGYRHFALGMAPFAAIGTESGSPGLERGLNLLAEHLDHFFSYRGLRAYKAKFDPEWEPRYLVYQSEIALPIVTLALARLTEDP